MDPTAFTHPEQLLASIALTMPRLFAVFAVTPFLSPNVITGMSRNSLMLMLALFMSPLAGDMPALSVTMWVAIAAKEALIGVMLGLGFGIFFWAIQSVGDLIDFQTGTSNAAFFDPVAGHDNGPTGEFLGWVVINLFVSAGGMLALVGAVVDSYRLWPVADFFPDLSHVIEAFAIRQGDTLFTWIVKLAAPVILVLMLVELGAGLLQRVAPQLNVFQSTQSLKGLLAALMMMLFMYVLWDSLQQFLKPDNGVLEFLRSSMRPRSG